MSMNPTKDEARRALAEAEKSDTRKWCWSPSADAEEAYGPHDSREEAIASAGQHKANGTIEVGHEIVIARCNFADPAEEFSTSFSDRILEQLDEDCDETLRNPDGDTFALNDGASYGSLDSLVRDWLRANVHAVWFAADGDTYETVRLEDDK